VVRVAIQSKTGEDGEDFLEDGIHLRAIENRFRLLLVSHFLQRKWETEDILGQAFPPLAVLAFDFDLIVNAETGIFAGEELFDHSSLMKSDHRARPRALSRKRDSGPFALRLRDRLEFRGGMSGSD
jgi:hypothetical protein